MIRAVIMLTAGILLLAIFQPTYDQIYNGWLIQLLIMITGVTLIIGGICAGLKNAKG